MPDIQIVGLTKVTKGFKTQFPTDAKRAIEKQAKKEFEPGDKIAWILEPNGRVYVVRATAQIIAQAMLNK